MAATMGMVQWSNLFDENAIWEDLDELSKQFSGFCQDSRGQESF
jgi:hypothetical protein